MTHPLLIIAIDYHQMFKGFLDALGKHKDVDVKGWKTAVDEEINWAKLVLKKNDRIVWYLRLARLKLIDDAQRSGFLPEGTLGKELSAYNAKAGPDHGINRNDIGGLRDDYRFKRDMQHYLSLEDAAIQQVRFQYQTPVQLMSQFKELEDVYKEKAQADARMLEPQEGDEAFIKFGNGWAWWALSRGYCSEEAKAMGHCGNQGMVTGDQILSLREPRKKGGKTYWEPHLTFIFDKQTGFLGEMKGRGNEKPAARYYPYIVSLLKDERIKGIKGGGYMPSHNFAMSDLPEDQQRELEDLKPELLTIRRMLKRKGITDVFRASRAGEIPEGVIPKVTALLGLKDYPFDPADGGWAVYEWKDVNEFVEERGNRTAKWIMEVERGDEFLNIDYTPPTSDLLDMMVNDLKEATIYNIGLELQTEYPNELKDFIENQGGADEFTWEPDQSGDVKDFIEYLNDEMGIEPEVVSELGSAYMSGSEAGAQNQMSEVLKDAVESATDSGERITIKFPSGSMWDGKIIAILREPDAIEAAMECEEGDGCDIDPDENPYIDDIITDVEVKVGDYHDFNDFDEGAFRERMEERYSSAPSKKKKPVEGQPELFPEVYEKAPEDDVETIRPPNAPANLVTES